MEKNLKNTKKILLISRNLLIHRQHAESGFLKELGKRSDLLVLCPTQSKKRRNYSTQAIDENKFAGNSRILRFLRLCRQLSSSSQNHTVAMMRKKEFALIPFPKKLMYRAAIFIYERSKICRRFLFGIEEYLVKKHIANEVEFFSGLDAFDPDIVVTTAFTGFYFDELIAEWAKSKNASWICLLASWDNPTTYGLQRYTPDTTLVWSTAMKADVVYYNNIEPTKVLVTGSLHFEALFKARPVKPKIIEEHANFSTYFTKSPRRFSATSETIRYLLENHIDHSKDEILVVKIHPLFFRTKTGESESFLKLIKELDEQKDISNGKIRILVPEMSNDVFDFRNHEKETAELRYLLENSRKIFNHFSTINIDAAYVGRTATNIHIGEEDFNKVGFRSTETIMDSEQIHNARIVNNELVEKITLCWKREKLTHLEFKPSSELLDFLKHEETHSSANNPPSKTVARVITGMM